MISTNSSSSGNDADKLMRNLITVKIEVIDHRYGFYHLPKFGLIADSKCLLRFLPHAPQLIAKPVSVRIMATPYQAGDYDIHSLPTETQLLVEEAEPKFIQAEGLVINEVLGEIFSFRYPRVRLFIAAKQRHNFPLGTFVAGRNFQMDAEGRFVASDVIETTRNRIPHVLTVNEQYSLMVMEVKMIEMKLASRESKDAYSAFLRKFNGRLSTMHGGLIDGDYDVNLPITHAIVGTNITEGAQTVFKFVAPFNAEMDCLDVKLNLRLAAHLQKLLPDFSTSPQQDDGNSELPIAFGSLPRLRNDFLFSQWPQHDSQFSDIFDHMASKDFKPPRPSVRRSKRIAEWPSGTPGLMDHLLKAFGFSCQEFDV